MKSIIVAIICVFLVLGIVIMQSNSSGGVVKPEKVKMEKPNNAVIESVGISDVWVRLALLKGRPSAAYLKITNFNADNITLISVTSEKFDRIEIHTHLMEEGVMKMRKIDELIVKPDETVELKPGGYHLMLFGIKDKLEKGGKFPMTLKFKGLDEKPIEVVVGQENLK